MGRMPADARPAQVIGHPGWLDLGGERSQPVEVGFVERIDRAQGKGDTVKHDRVVAARRPENPPRVAAFDHEVLGDDLQPIHAEPAGGRVVILRRPQSQAASEVRKTLHLTVSP